ncbi:MAG: hypothetical protein ABFS45_06540 [Pseudomonadota bacterium]
MNSVKNEPTEGAAYRMPTGEEFTVLYTGLRDGDPGFIIKRDGCIGGHPLAWWTSPLFNSPTPIVKGASLTYKDYFGIHHLSLTRWCQAIKHTSGELDIIFLEEKPEWINTQARTTH